jgi:hypothetical protein
MTACAPMKTLRGTRRATPAHAKAMPASSGPIIHAAGIETDCMKNAATIAAATISPQVFIAALFESRERFSFAPELAAPARGGGDGIDERSMKSGVRQNAQPLDRRAARRRDFVAQGRGIGVALDQ